MIEQGRFALFSYAVSYEDATNATVHAQRQYRKWFEMQKGQISGKHEWFTDKKYYLKWRPSQAQKRKLKLQADDEAALVKTSFPWLFSEPEKSVEALVDTLYDL